MRPHAGTAAAFPSFLFLAAQCGCPMVMRMMKKIAVLCVAASASRRWCGCDRKPAAGEKQAAPSGKREEPAEEKGEAAACLLYTSHHVQVGGRAAGAGRLVGIQLLNLVVQLARTLSLIHI